MLHFADGMRAGDGTAVLDCDEFHESLSDDLVQSMLMSMWDDAPEAGTDEPIAKTDRRTKNRVYAQLSRAADKEYVKLMLAELESLTETFEMHAAYITQLKVHAADAGDSMLRLGQTHAQNKIKIAILREIDTVSAVPTLMGMPTKDRNRIHARTSRQRKRQLVQDLIKQRDESWGTVQEVTQHTTALESACSVLYDFEDAGCVSLQLAETRQTLLMRTGAHKKKYDELECRLSYRVRMRDAA